jgi:hypothetical protein
MTNEAPEPQKLLGVAELARACGTTASALRRLRYRAAKGEFKQPFPGPDFETSTDQSEIAGWLPQSVPLVKKWIADNLRGLDWRKGVIGDIRYSKNQEQYAAAHKPSDAATGLPEDETANR